MSKSSVSTGTILAVLVAIAVAGTGGYMIGNRSGQKSASVSDVAVATVNSEKIAKLTVYDRMAGQYGKQTVDRLVDEALVNQAAKAAGINVTPAEVEAEVSKLRERIGGEEKLQQAMAQYGITTDQLKEDQAHRLKITKLLSKDIKVDDATLRDYFEKNIEQFDKREVQSRHILSKTQAEAQAIKAELDKGADFTKLAKEKSTDPSAQQNGGELGLNARGKMVPEFDKVVFNTPKGQITAPFETEHGWHVAQVLDVKGTLPTIDSVKAQVTEAVIQEQIQEKIQPWLDEQKAKAKITNTFATDAAKK